jgi:hypothetical protein
MRYRQPGAWNRCIAVLIAICCAAAALFPTRLTAAPPDPPEKDVDESIVRALRYLAQRQQPSGAWSIDSFGESTAATSLAVMSFLAAGHAPGEGPYGQVITRGVEFVVSCQAGNGMLVKATGHGPMYDHGISTLMLAEVSGMVPERQAVPTRRALEKAVRLILQAQVVPKPENQRGGWRYAPQSADSDLSVTAWQLLALRAAKDIGCDVPAENIEMAVGYVKRCCGRDGRGFGYQPGQGSTLVLSGTGLLALQVCGEEDSAEVHRTADFLDFRPIRFQDGWFNYGIYYTTIGMYKRGGDNWKNARPLLFKELLSHQSPDGSWASGNPNENQWGRIYCTSMSVLALSVEYEYLPIYQR